MVKHILALLVCLLVAGCTAPPPHTVEGAPTGPANAPPGPPDPPGPPAPGPDRRPDVRPPRPLGVCPQDDRPPHRGYAAAVTGPDGRVEIHSGFGSSELDALALDQGTRLDRWAFDAASGCWNRTGDAPFLNWDMAYARDLDLYLGYDFFVVGEEGPAAWPINIAQPVSEFWTRQGDGPWDVDQRVDIPARSSPAIAYDQGSGFFVMFGGCAAAFACLDETWLYDPGDGSWTLQDPPVRPPARNFAALEYDPRSERLVLFGGHHTGAEGTQVVLNDTWLYDVDHATWSLLEPAVSPPARVYPHLALVPGLDRMYIFGGEGAGHLGDLWYLDLGSWEWVEVPVLGPSPRARHAMAYDAEAGVLVLFGGGDSVDCPYWDETWVFDPLAKAWHYPDRRDPDEDPHPRTGHLCDL